MSNFFKNQADFDAFVSSIKNKNGEPFFKNANEALQSFLGAGGLAGANEFFNALTNKLVTQFVYDMTLFPTFLRKNHFRGEFQYGDHFEHIWQLQNWGNVKKYSTDSYTPTDLKNQGIKLKRPQIVYHNKQNVQITNGLLLDEKLVYGAFQPNAIGAANKLITVYLGTIDVEIDEFYYNLEPKVVKVGCKNTITLKGNTDWTKPSYIENDTQYQLSFLKHLLNKMTLPTRGKYSMLGKIGDDNPLSTLATKPKLKKENFPVRKLNSISDAFFYVSADLKTRFETFCYATTFNQQFLSIANSMYVMPLDEAQVANGDEVLDDDPFGKMMKPAQVADDPETIYLCVKDSFAVMDRFNVRTTSNWVQGQLVIAVAQFTDYTWLPWNIGLKIKLSLK